MNSDDIRRMIKVERLKKFQRLMKKGMTIEGCMLIGDLTELEVKILSEKPLRPKESRRRHALYL